MLLNFGLNRPFRRFRPIQPELAQINPIQRKSAQVCAVSARVGMSREEKEKRAGHGTDAQAAVSPPSRVTVFDAGVAPLAPRPCFLV